MGLLYILEEMWVVGVVVGVIGKEQGDAMVWWFGFGYSFSNLSFGPLVCFYFYFISPYFEKKYLEKEALVKQVSYTV